MLILLMSIFCAIHCLLGTDTLLQYTCKLAEPTDKNSITNLIHAID